MNTKYNVGQEISTVVEATETICGIKVNTKGAVMYNMKSGKTYTEEALSKIVVEDKPKEVKEIKRAAKTGEYIKITDCPNNCSFEGKVCRALNDDNPRDFRVEVLPNMQKTYVRAEYVVLENYVPDTKPKEEPRFKVGDKVKFHSWDDMVGKKIRYGFTRDMKHLCGTTATIESINGEDVKLTNFSATGDAVTWDYSTDMLEPYTEPEQKEPIARLYCVEGYKDIEGKKWTKGNVYNLDANGFLECDDGRKSKFAYKSYSDFCNQKAFLGVKEHFVPLVSRPAKVGEWVFVTGGKSRLGNNHKYEISKIYKVFGAGINNCVWFDNDCKGNVGEQDYLVLDGYQPKEPFKPYLECDGENCGIIGETSEITAFAETPLNVGDVVEVTKASGYKASTSIVINSDGTGIMGHHSASKNMKNGSIASPCREHYYVRKIRDYTELKDGETIHGVTVHLTEKGE